MKKIMFVILAIISCIIIFLIVKLADSPKGIKIIENNIRYQIAYKGIQGARDFAYDESGNIYIAYKDKIQFVDKKGKSYFVFDNKSYNIYSLVYNKRKLYFSTDNKVISYDLDSQKEESIIDNLSNYGDYKELLLKCEGNSLYVTIGAATNSGVVGSDNKWLKDTPFCYDITPQNIIVKGNNFGENKTGAFVPNGTSNVKNQVIAGHMPGNASIICINLNNKSVNLTAWGIRNVTGIDINSEGKIYAVVGGMEDRGLRPVKGDCDYVYEIKKGVWYGWPDYSGGDPVSSPRFKENSGSKLAEILENAPNLNPPAPFYQNKHCSTMKCLAIDRNGKVGEKDSIYFCDSKDNIIYELSKAGILKEKVISGQSSYIKSLKFSNDGLSILDANKGCIYNINKGINSNNNSNTAAIYYIIIALLLSLIVIILKIFK